MTSGHPEVEILSNPWIYSTTVSIYRKKCTALHCTLIYLGTACHLILPSRRIKGGTSVQQCRKHVMQNSGLHSVKWAVDHAVDAVHETHMVKVPVTDE